MLSLITWGEAMSNEEAVCEECKNHSASHLITDYRQRTYHLCDKCSEIKLEEIEKWFVHLQLSLEGFHEDLQLSRKWVEATDKLHH